jgi:hypothetical protein
MRGESSRSVVIGNSSEGTQPLFKDNACALLHGGRASYNTTRQENGGRATATGRAFGVCDYEMVNAPKGGALTNQASDWLALLSRC